MADEYILKSYDGGAETTTLTSPFTVGGTTLVVANGSTFPDGSSGPFVVVIDRGLATEEKFLIDTTTGTNGITFNIQQPAYDGTSASSHSIGATVEHCLDAYSIEQANRYVNLQSVKGDLIAHNGTTTTKLGVGSNNHVLIADSAQSVGLKYGQVVEASIATGAVTESKLADDAVTAAKLAADAVVANSIDTATTGTTGQVLTANTGVSSGLEWTTPAEGFTMPAGVIAPYAGTSEPSGWVFCNGNAVSRTTYAALFDVIGTTYGAGDGSTTFNLPDLRHKFVAGKGADTSNNGWSDTLGETGGSKNAVVVSHDHDGATLGGVSNPDASFTLFHSAGSSYSGLAATGYSSTGGSTALGGGTPDFPGANHAHSIPTDGVSGTDKNLPPYITLNYIIKT